jgi:hypothetical protein
MRRPPGIDVSTPGNLITGRPRVGGFHRYLQPGPASKLSMGKCKTRAVIDIDEFMRGCRPGARGLVEQIGGTSAAHSHSILIR